MALQKIVMGSYFLGMGQTILKLKHVSASRLRRVKNNFVFLWLEEQTRGQDR